MLQYESQEKSDLGVSGLSRFHSLRSVKEPVYLVLLFLQDGLVEILSVSVV